MSLAAPIAAPGLRLEPLDEVHRERLRAACEQDSEIWLIYPANFSGPDFERNFAACLGLDRTAPFAVFDGESLVGMSSFLNIDTDNHVVEIGRTYFAPFVRGTGFNRRVKQAMLDRAFAEGFTRVEFRVDTRNARSMAAVERLGARLDGVLRKNRITWTGFVRDTAIYAILADEWAQSSSSSSASSGPTSASA